VRKPNLNAAYFVHRDVQPGRNHWPDLPGFRDNVLAYFAAMERLADRLLPLYALSLDLPADWFAPHFRPASCTLRMSHYPLVPHEQEQWGLAPHTDSTFMTLLPANDVPGLEIRPQRALVKCPPMSQRALVKCPPMSQRALVKCPPMSEGHEWIAPPPLEQSFLVNSGDILRRWTNDAFLSTAHRVRNQSGRDRYAIPFFYGARNDTLIEALPTCVGSDNPPRYEPITNGDYQRWFRNRNYASYTGEEAGPEVP
jgi:isopenicillin N synthase-like dioxygenase